MNFPSKMTCKTLNNMLLLNTKYTVKEHVINNPYSAKNNKLIIIKIIVYL